MKTINKIGSLLLASALIFGCSDDDLEMNSTDATVGMAKAEMIVKESADIFKVPILVEGEQNGAVNVTLSVEEYGNNKAQEDIHYIVTDKTLTIAPEDKQGMLEIRAVDDEEINEARTFIVKIASVDGAKLDESKSVTIVTLKDNDSNFYEKLAGKWSFTADGEKADAKFVIYSEDDPKYEKEMVLVIERQGVPMQFTVNYSFDVATKKVGLVMPLGEMIASGLDFGDPVGICDVYSSLVKDQKINFKGEIEWVLSDDMKSITANTDAEIAGALFTTGTTDFTGYTWFGFVNAVLSR